MIQGCIWGKVYIIMRTTIMCWLKQERKTCESPKGGVFSAEGDGISRNGARPLVSPVDFFCIGKKGKFGGCASQVRPPTGLKRIGCRTLPVKTGLTLF
jgi:hypothetical protein